MKRCSWCDKRIWPPQHKSDGGTMHARCADYVQVITASNQRQYSYPPLESWEEQQWRLRKEEEDRL